MADTVAVTDFSAFNTFPDGVPGLHAHSAALAALFSPVNNLQTDILKIPESVKVVDPGTLPEDFIAEAWVDEAGLPDPTIVPNLYIREDSNLWFAPNDPDNYDLGDGTPASGTAWLNLALLGATDTITFDEHIPATDLATTSSSFVDVDATNMSFTLTNRSGMYLVGFTGLLSHTYSSTRLVYVTVALDGTNIGNPTGGIQYIDSSNSNVKLMDFTTIVPASIGSHTLKLQWSMSGANGSAVMYGDPNFSRFWVAGL